MTRYFLALAGLLILALLAAPFLWSQDPLAGPWSKSDLMAPAALVKILNSPGKPPTIICVAFPVLYRQRHIVHAILAGPAGQPEGIQALRKAVTNLPKNSEVVIYCGCCPMQECPNIRPAYQALKQMGFTRLHVLALPTNFHVDWSEKGYPVE